MAATKHRPHTTTYGSLAYDLDALARDRQLEEAGAMPEKRQEPQVRPVQRARTHPRAHARPSPVLLGGIALLGVMVMVLMLGYVQLTKVSTSVSQIKRELTELQDEHVSLLTTYERTFDLATIKEVAENAGMSKPSSGQIEYIDLSGADSTVVYRADVGGALHSVFSAVGSGVRELWEYFN